jgi:murein DD-endopeptidase MepM/ murein hydrolase activator NlpD
VAAPVIDPFRAPPGPFAAGNRGIEYETRPGTAIVTVAAGRVVFAGPVAGSLHVTVLHEDGLRSSYSYLATVGVAVGDTVRAGEALGTATGRLHLGVRAGDAYLDPAVLFDHGEVHLVPTPSG